MLSPEPDSEPPSINPYAVLQVPNTATADDIKKAYRRLALRLHPDKAAPSERASAHKAFQDLAFAYAMLSDERRRKRYDATGNTAETLDIDGDEFDWRDFFRAQFDEVVTADKIEEFKNEYRGSDEEHADVLKWYEQGKGDMNKVFEGVMLSDVLEDEKRFREYIDAAIEKGEVEAFEKYTKESEKSRKQRVKRARKERKEAEEYEKELKANGSGKRTKSKGGGGGMEDLAAMIQSQQAARSTFLDDLEAKYAGANGAKGSKRKMEEPPEEAFARTGSRKKTRNADVVDSAQKDGKRSSRKKARAS